MSNPTGGPAFPLSTVDPFDQSVTTCDGMTLRDYIAAKVLQGIYSNPERKGTCVDAVHTAYEVADSALKAR